MLLLSAFAIVVLASRRSIGVTASGVRSLSRSHGDFHRSYWTFGTRSPGGNAVYPLGVSIAGAEIFPGPGPERNDTILNSAGSFHLGDMISALAIGYGVFFWLAIGMALISVAWGLHTARHNSVCVAPASPARLPLIAGLMIASLLLYLRTPYSIMQVAGSAPITALELVGGMRFSLITGACATVPLASGLNYMPKRLNPAWVVVTMALIEGLLAGYDIRFFDFFPAPIFTLPRLLATGVFICVALFALRGLAEVNWQHVAWLRAWHRPRVWISATVVAVLVAGLGLAYLYGIVRLCATRFTKAGMAR